MFFTSITNSEEWRASICLCMHNVYTVIFNPLHRVVTPEDVIVALVTYIKLLRVSVHNLQHRFGRGCLLLLVTWLSTVNLDFTVLLWEAHFTCMACGSGACAVCSLTSTGKVAWHNTNVGDHDLTAAMLLWYFIHWTEPAVLQSASADLSLYWIQSALKWHHTWRCEAFLRYVILCCW